MEEPTFETFNSLLFGKTSFEEFAYAENKKRIRKLFTEQFVLAGVCSLLSLIHKDALLYLTKQVEENLLSATLSKLAERNAPLSITEEDVAKIIEEVAQEFTEKFEGYRNSQGVADQATP